jgi:hypothetical protein
MDVAYADATAGTGIPPKEEQLRFEKETLFLELAEHKHTRLPYKIALETHVPFLSVNGAGDFGANGSMNPRPTDCRRLCGRGDRGTCREEVRTKESPCL